jgi:hypothetical protein
MKTVRKAPVSKTAKTRKSTTPKVAKVATYSDLLAVCIRPSRMIDSLDKTITKFASKNDAVLDVWSFAGESHDIAVGQRCLLRVKHMPDGKVFYNLQ